MREELFICEWRSGCEHFLKYRIALTITNLCLLDIYSVSRMRNFVILLTSLRGVCLLENP